MKRKNTNRLFVFSVMLVAVLAVVTPASASEFLVYMADDLIGVEQVTVAEDSVTTNIELTVQGQTSKLQTTLSGTARDWDSYQFASGPFVLNGESSSDGTRFSIGENTIPVDLQQPNLLLEGNVFYHYQEAATLVSEQGEAVEFTALIPSRILMNLPPQVSAVVELVGVEYYELDENVIALREYSITIEKVTYIKLLTDSAGNMVQMEIPAQSVKAVNREFEGITKLASEQIGELSIWEEDFLVENGDIQLAGTLSFPAQGDGPFPVVFLNSGSGPQNRDGNTPPSFMTNMFRDMAHRLGEAGIAVMRYDERGMGESTGDYSQATLDNLVSDVETLITYLKGHALIDASRIAVLGHSEGGVIAPLILANDPQLAAGIIVAAPSTPLDHILIEQLEYQASLDFISDQERESIKGYIPMFKQLVADAKAGKDESVVPMNMEWLRQHMAHDPIATIEQVDVPLLIVQGTEDLKVRPYHAQALADAAKDGGNQDVTLEFLDKVGHELTYFPIDNPEFDPRNPLRISERLFEITTQWLIENLVD